MQVLVNPKTEFVPFPWTDSKISFGKNAELPTCPVRHGEIDRTPLESLFLNEKAVPFAVGDNRITDLVLFDPDWPTSIDEIVFRLATMEIAVQPKTEVVEKELPPSVPESKTIQNTSLLQDAQRLCNSFRTGWEEYVNQKTETRNKLNYIREENIDIFLNKTVPLVAFDINQIIEILIKIEGIPERFFGDYKKVKEQIDNETDLEQRAKHTRKLAMILESKIPATVKYNVPKSIMPTINAKQSGSADMEQWKSTRGT